MNGTLLITGASSGIGASLVRHLAGDYEVLALARRIDRMNREYGDHPSIHPYELDLADADGTRSLLADLVAEWGHIPYLLNVAGIWNTKSLLELTDEDLRLAMEVDAFAHVRTMQALLPAMREHDFGRIVNVSGTGVLVPMAGWAAQYASIMARNAYGVTAAHENDDRNVKINLMGPGPTSTEMYDGPLPPTACHSTVDYLLGLDADGPTGRMFWLGYEVPLFPELGATELFGPFHADEEYLTRVCDPPEELRG
ncbi:SDR family NAD(P)-dependent oxidoreductase [Halomarina oriensis]|uniref:SDR family NAD(P)-dependent oxidoreductase n=1 Tax=Halomarina oriensis TaxID=671145 RepID=A0A6B0GN34_9EURY|nr:SDR family NAD(P)-dependent oxidoreductase [Halomarina oriensis]MWG36184.1 SDR family NAD(P)-dependent oxidoreductase [Halomarina oriensis]